MVVINTTITHVLVIAEGGEVANSHFNYWL